MKKKFVVPILALSLFIAAGQQQAQAGISGLFGVAEGTKVTIKDMIFRVNPKTGLIISNSGSGFSYDTTSGLAVSDEGAMIVTGNTKKFLSNIMSNPAKWDKYLNTKACSIEAELKEVQPQGNSLLPEIAAPQNEGKCLGLYDSAVNYERGIYNFIMFNTNKINDIRNDIRYVVDLTSGRGPVIEKIFAKHGLNKKLFSATEKKDMPALFTKLKSDIFTEIKEATKDFPPESEIVQREWKRGKFGKPDSDFMDWKWNLNGKKSFKNINFQEYLGWIAFQSDILVNQLSHVDYPLRNPAADPDYKNAVISNFRTTIPLWKNNYKAFSLENGDLQDQNGFWILPDDIDKKKLWENWGPFEATLSPDEMRKLILSGGNTPYRENTVIKNSGEAGGLVYNFNALGFPEHKGKEVRIKTGNGSKSGGIPASIIHNTGMLMAPAMGIIRSYKTSPAIINVPNAWVGTDNPGLTLQRYLFFFIPSHADKPNAPGWAVLRNVANGDYNAAKSNLSSFDTELARVKGIAGKRAAEALAKIDKKALIADISGNPSAAYRELIKLIAPEVASQEVVSVTLEENIPKKKKVKRPRGESL